MYSITSSVSKQPITSCNANIGPSDPIQKIFRRQSHHNHPFMRGGYTTVRCGEEFIAPVLTIAY